MGTLLVVIGVIWAGLGIGNLALGLAHGLTPGWLTASLMINMLLFVLPGLFLIGLGELLRRRRSDR